MDEPVRHRVEIPLSKDRANRTGFLDIDSEPRGDVYVGGRKVGAAPVRRVPVPAGTVGEIYLGGGRIEEA